MSNPLASRLRRDRRGVVTTEYVGAAVVCALCLVFTYRGYTDTLTAEVEARVDEISSGFEPVVPPSKPGLRPPTATKPRPTQPKPGQRPGGDPPRCVGDSCPAGNGQCFAAGTLVHTEHGDRPIETVGVGDKVWSRDAITGAVALKPVTRRFETPNMPVLELQIASELSSETLTVTPGHPFWVDARGWVDSDALEAGAPLWSPGAALTARAIEISGRRETVYNIEIQDFHTYFVGTSHAWVHNAPRCPPKYMPQEEFCFPIPPEHVRDGLADEWEDQLLTQEAGLGEMTVEQYLANRARFKRDGRLPDSSQAREPRVYRDHIAKDIVETWLAEERAQGREPSSREQRRKLREAKKTAAGLLSAMNPQAATHNPDQIAGGDLGVHGLGDSRVNSSIGPLWKRHVDALDRAALAVPPNERATTRMNVSLYYSSNCP